MCVPWSVTPGYLDFFIHFLSSPHKWKIISNDVDSKLDDWSEGCSLHVVALLDLIWIDKLHRLSLPTGKWAQLPFFGPASHWNPLSGWHYSYSKRETLRATQAPKIVNSPLRPDHSDNNTQFNNTLACNHITP